ncbi:ACT domain-containing protein [Demequina aurantiaca]|uniref:ACT domain-containing protein n=1 Tax=Demequina aurantiaca TaxID=676200 RepID=UPI003D3270E9
MSGETDLATLIASMRPRLESTVYVWATVPFGTQVPDAVVTVREAEGLTVVLPQARGDELGLDYEFPSARITLEVHSALEAVGLTAAFAQTLTDQGISANVVAGFHHDHIFVPFDRAVEATAALERLAAGA